ncbi:MZB1 protein, partial [Dromaius novaehollandiae]|nr:marginal zone B- and B1-cell-specific protein [Dromaius novaehollandiae]NXG35514.1 MZB1 protein [Dromaius novaehollandiae]
MRPLLAACVALSFVAGRKAEDMCGGPPAPAQPSHSMSSPRLSAEETHSAHMPEHLRCDACRAIAFQIREHLGKAESKRSPSRKAGAELRESEYMEALEKSCSQSWDSYGVLEVNGEKRLAGPGLLSQEPMSVMIMGGPWPGRLHKMCHSYVGELGEEQLYQAHRSGPAALEELLCHGAKGACAGLRSAKGRAPAPAKALQNEL